MDMEVTGWWPADEHARLGLLERVLSDASPLRESVDLLADAVAVALDVPVALVSLVGRERQFFLGQSHPNGETLESVPVSHSFCRHVVARGERLVVTEAIDDPIVCDNPSIQEYGVRSYLGEPVIVRGRTLGSFCAFDFQPREWSARDIAALRGFADVVQQLISGHLAAENELADAREVSVAQNREHNARLRVFEALAADELEVPALHRRFRQARAPRPAAGGLGVEVHYQAGSDRLLLGGDFVDTHEDERGVLSFALGDVSGDGPEAAALAIGLRSAWRALQSVGTDLLQMVAVLDRQTAEADLYATLLLGCLTPSGRLALVNAGHPDPIAVGQATMELGTELGPMLGLGLDSSRWRRTDHDLSGQTLLAYTDGLVEDRIHRSAERFGIDQLLASIAELGPDPAALCEAASQVNGQPLADDVAILRIAPSHVRLG